MDELKLGILLWSQATEWPDMVDAAKRIDRLGYDYLWTWDHLYAISGDPYQPIFEGWTTLGGLAMATERVRLGLMVGANTFRNPGLVAKSATTLDHVSGGRAILGLGGAWFELEHHAHGIDFGSGFGQRLDWLDESVGIIRALLDGAEVDHKGARYTFDHAVHHPLPVQSHLPILIGGSGEKKTLRTVARYADIWNAIGSVDELGRKNAILNEHCVAVGRNPLEIDRTLACKMVIRDSVREARRTWEGQLAYNRTPKYFGREAPWLGSPARIAEIVRSYQAVGIDTVTVEMPTPYDTETIERLIGEVRALV